MANSADPDQLVPEEANWSGSTLFAKVGSFQSYNVLFVCTNESVEIKYV